MNGISKRRSASGRDPSSGDGGDRHLFGEVVLKAFGTIGLRDYTGTPVPALYDPQRDRGSILHGHGEVLRAHFQRHRDRVDSWRQ
jgi:hypothetical protein